MIFVSGANGQFARAVIRNVLAAGRATSLIVGTRDVHSAFAQALAGQGVRVREADYRRPDLMRQALDGVEKALFIPTYDANELRLRQNLNAIEAARDSGVKHVVYASFLRAESARVEHSRLVHYPTEQAMRDSGLAFTLLRDTLASGLLRRPGGRAGALRLYRARGSGYFGSADPAARRALRPHIQRDDGADLVGRGHRAADVRGLRQTRALPGGTDGGLAPLHDRTLGCSR